MNQTQNENKETVRQLVAEVFNDGRLDLIDDFYADDCVIHNPAAPGDIHGPEGWRGLMAQVKTAFPDFTVAIEDCVTRA